MTCVGLFSSGVTGLAFLTTRETQTQGPTPEPGNPTPPKPGEPEPDVVKAVTVGNPSRPALENTPGPEFDASACEQLSDGGPVNGPGCLTDVLTCGGDMIGHTVGGVDMYSTRFYEKKFCWPATYNHDAGNERVYKLTMPPGEHRARITLTSPCADLDVTAIRFDGDTCPTMNHQINQCEMVPRDGTQMEQIEVVSQTRGVHQAVWWVVVEGKDDQDGAFQLHVDCEEGLGGPYAIDSLQTPKQ